MQKISNKSTAVFLFFLAPFMSLVHRNNSQFKPLQGRGGGGGGGGGAWRSLDLTSNLEAKFGARSGQVHQIRGKTWKILLPQDTKVGKKS